MTGIDVIIVGAGPTGLMLAGELRPDAHIAWAAAVEEPTDIAAPALREALTGWFGTPVRTAPDHP